MARKPNNVTSPVEPEKKTKRTRVVRNFPTLPFEEAFTFARKIFEFGSGSPVRRLSIFDHISRSPESSASRSLIIAAGKYGLIKGGVQAEQLELTPNGLKAVNEQIPSAEQRRAKFQAAIADIEPFRFLFERFSGNKLPAKAALKDAAIESGVESSVAEEVADTFVINLEFIGILQTLSGASRIITLEHFLNLSADQSSRSDARLAESDGVSQGDSTGATFALMTGDAANFEKTCFYITPIGAEDSEERLHSDLFLGQLVEPAISPLQLDVVRADRIQRSGAITKQILEYVLNSRLVVVDLSFLNPNVFYELAVRHATGKPVVQIVRKGDRIPFDINQQRTIIIDNSSIYTLMPKAQTYVSEIAAQARAAINNQEASDNPIGTYFPSLRLQ